MYLPFEGGTVEHIQGLDIHVPPVGYVPDYYLGAGELIKSDILFTDKPALEQKWKRQPLPDWYEKKYKAELKGRESNPEHRDDDLQQVRKLHWQRRLNGVWVMIKGNPVYLTGKHWFYMNWWMLDTGYPNFRENDRKHAYFWQYCVEDPDCVGMLESTKRKNGKTFRAGCYQFEYASRIVEGKMGIQSKSRDDARDQVYLFSIISPFKKLPDFFKPIWDTAQGSIPKSELAFRHTSVKGKESRNQTFEGELNTVIDWRAAEIKAYDGPKLQAYIGDEVLKTDDVDVYTRHGVVKECCTADGVFIGKTYYTSTVEKDENKQVHKENDPAYKLYKDSDQSQKENGRTITGLYRYFTPAYETLYWDEWGYPLIDKAKEYYQKERARLESDPKAYVEYIRRNPFSWEESFMASNDSCPFNEKVLREALNTCYNLPRDSPDIEVRGDFVWEVVDQKVIFVPNPSNGRWWVAWLPTQEQQNKVRQSGSEMNRFEPLNNERHALGSDPVDSGDEAKFGESSAAIIVHRKFDIHDPERSGIPVAVYKYDPSAPEEYYEDLIMACFFYGAEVFIESNKPDVFRYFRERGYNRFIMMRPENTFTKIPKPGEQVQGGYASGQLIDLYITRLKTMFSLHGHKIRLKTVLEDALAFRYTTRGKRDITVAGGYAQIAAEKKYEPPKAYKIDVYKTIMDARR